MHRWDMIHKIKKSLDEGLSVSEIARRLHVDRKTVRKYRDMTEEEIRRVRRQSKRRSRKIDRFAEWLKQRVLEYEEDGVVNCESLYRELVGLGFTGSARTVRRYVVRMRKKKRKRIYEPFETPIGRQAMVDLGEARNLHVGQGRATMFFVVIVLSWSRKKYGEWYERPVTTEMFLRSHERAFRAFGGIPAQMVYDQTKLAVLKERYGECEFNEDFYGFARFYGFEPFICNKYDPETKGKVESAIRYAKRGFLPGRTFVDTTDVQIQWEDWLKNVADAKAHETTGRPPNEMWFEEKNRLKSLPDGFYHVLPSMERRKVLANGLVKVLGNAYSVPAAYHGAKVLVRVMKEKVEFYDLSRRLIWTHWRGSGRGRRFIDKSHYERQYSVPTEDLEKEVLGIYDNPAMLRGLKASFPRHYREQLKGLIRLHRDHAADVLREAAERAVLFGCVGLGNLEKIARGVEGKKKSISFVTPKGGRSLATCSGQVRSMSYYAKVVQEKQEAQDERTVI